MSRVSSVAVMLSSGIAAASWAVPGAAEVTSEDDASNPSVTPPAPPLSTFRLGIGTGVAIGLSKFEEQDSDVYTSMQAAHHWSLSVAPSYRLAPSWAVGLRGSWSSDAGARGSTSNSGEEVNQTQTLWQLSAEGRYQPGAQQGFYLALGAGAARVSDSIGSATAAEWGPLLSTAFGYDIGLADFLALGIELRGAFASLSEEGASLERAGATVRYVYGPSSWLGLNLIGQFEL